MNKKVVIALGIVIIILIIVLGIRFFSGEDNWVCQDGKWLKHGQPNTAMPTTGCGEVVVDKLEYQNTQYGFSLSLPLSWQGYLAVTEEWSGNIINSQLEETIAGPKILIRHPLWTAENPRQDIPVMIFTLDQWALIQAEKLAVSAAPIGPSELGRNATYVFALPARYNYAFPSGFEEVDSILQAKPLQAF